MMHIWDQYDIFASYGRVIVDMIYLRFRGCLIVIDLVIIG